MFGLQRLTVTRGQAKGLDQWRRRRPWWPQLCSLLPGQSPMCVCLGSRSLFPARVCSPLCAAACHIYDAPPAALQCTCLGHTRTCLHVCELAALAALLNLLDLFDESAPLQLSQSAPKDVDVTTGALDDASARMCVCLHILQLLYHFLHLLSHTCIYMALPVTSSCLTRVDQALPVLLAFSWSKASKHACNTTLAVATR